MKRKQIIITLAAILLAAFAWWVASSDKSTTINNYFLVPDTASVTKIYMVDKNNNEVTLWRKPGHSWRLNDDIPPVKENIDLILKTLTKIDIKRPVSKAAHNTEIKRLATRSVKVEIYATRPAFRIFGTGFFTKERLINTFYIGGPTRDYKGTLMKSDKDDRLFITYIPGFNGYLSERFSPKTADWVSHEIFAYPVSMIKTLEVDLPETPRESYRIESNNNRTFNLYRAFDNSLVANYDTIRLLDELAAFNRIRFESLLDDTPLQRIDSLRNTRAFKVVKLTLNDGTQRKLTMYHRYNFEKVLDLDGKPFTYDMDRMYAFVDDDTIPVAVQFFVTDNITRPLSWFTKTTNNKQQTTNNEQRTTNNKTHE